MDKDNYLDCREISIGQMQFEIYYQVLAYLFISKFKDTLSEKLGNIGRSIVVYSITKFVRLT